MAFNFSPKIITDGLIMLVDAANPVSYVNGKTVWKDLTQYKNDGNLINAPTFNAANGGSIVFDGSNDFVNFGKVPTFNNVNNFTFSVAFNSTQSATFRGIFGEGVENNTNTVTGVRYTLELNSGYIRWWVLNSIKDTSVAYNDGKWHICTITQDSSGNYKCYVDGIERVSTTQTAISLGVESFAIGSWHNISYTYAGKVAFLHVYNRVLSIGEVLQNFNALKGRFGII